MALLSKDYRTFILKLGGRGCGLGDLGQLKPLQLGVAGGAVEHTEWHNVTKAL